MKILQIHNFYKFFGGEDKVVLNEEALLKNHGQTVLQFTKNNKEIDSYTIMQKAFFFPRIICNKPYLNELRTCLIKEKPDIAHVHNIYPLLSIGIYKVLYDCGIPIVQSFHDHRLSLLCPQGNAFKKNHPCELCHQGNYLNCLKYICVKNNLIISTMYALGVYLLRKRNILNRYLSAGIFFNDYMKLKLIRIGIKNELLHCKPHFLTETTGTISFCNQGYAVYLGAVSRHKGIFTLLKSFENINHIQLKILGDGDAVDYVKERISQQNNIEYLGEIKGEQRFSVLKNAFCLILPTECFETFGLSIMEAFACGVPVISSRIGGIPYIIDDGVNGILFNTGDSNDLKEKILFLYSRPEIQNKMAKEALRKYEREFTKDSNYHQLMHIYQSAIERRKKINL